MIHTYIPNTPRGQKKKKVAQVPPQHEPVTHTKEEILGACRSVLIGQYYLVNPLIFFWSTGDVQQKRKKLNK